jgi:hypothetical protein
VYSLIAMNRIEKFRGCLLGLGVGDSLGAAVEGSAFPVPSSPF